jgi:hypothetical protein
MGLITLAVKNKLVTKSSTEGETWTDPFGKLPK